MVYRQFGPKTLRTQDISELCVWCRSVSHFRIGHFGTSAEVSRTVRTKVHETLRTQNKNRPIFECVKNVDPLYIHYSNGMEVLGK